MLGCVKYKLEGPIKISSPLGYLYKIDETKKNLQSLLNQSLLWLKLSTNTINPYSWLVSIQTMKSDLEPDTF